MDRHVTSRAERNRKRQIAIVWSIEDVQAVRSDLNDEQCMAVLEAVLRCHDANVGVNWLTIEMCAENIYCLSNSTC